MPRPPEPSPAPVRRTLWLRRLAGLACLGALTIYALSGCQAPSFSSLDWPDWASLRSQSPDEEEDEEESGTPKAGTKLDTPLVGEYVTAFGGTDLIPVEGVGLVVGLDKTGEDPPPSQYRTQLVDEMKKNGVENPNTWLARPDTAMVLIKAYMPVNIRKGEPFDVEVTLPSNSEATSLAGGYLLEARLSEKAVTQGGRILSGHLLATAKGPVLVSTSEDKSAAAGLLRRGRILGGGKSRIDRDLAVFLRNEFRSTRNTMRVSQAVGKRFHGHDKHGIKVPMAEAKDDQKILLKVPEEYEENYPRYLNVIRNLAFRETDIARRLRLEKLEQQLNEPETSETAALRLEGIGAEAIPVLKRALDHEDLEVRFNASMALTYMGETEGLHILAEAAREEPAFRVYALAALASSKEAQASAELRELLSEKSSETRYGAFRALTVLNDKDPIVDAAPMKGEYKLHVLAVDGPPLVHLTHHTKAEVVLFGADQTLQTPAVLRAGPHIQVIAPSGSREATVARHSGGKNGKKVVPLKLAEIIRACDELGANYPDIAGLLAQAHKQKNLPGELEIDALPEAGRAYVAKNSKSGGKRTVGSAYTAPPIYAPATSEAAAARNEDLKEVTVEEPKKDVAKSEEGVKAADNATGKRKKDSALKPAGAEEDGRADVVTAVDETPASDSVGQAPASDEPGQTDAPTHSVIGDEYRWFDPRRLMKAPTWSKGEAPEQSEPEGN